MDPTLDLPGAIVDYIEGSGAVQGTDPDVDGKRFAEIFAAAETIRRRRGCTLRLSFTAGDRAAAIWLRDQLSMPIEVPSGFTRAEVLAAGKGLQALAVLLAGPLKIGDAGD
jgi:hypothetical protein